ncbi:MAG: hypothetical protein ACLTUL_07695 [Blautia faecis]
MQLYEQGIAYEADIDRKDGSIDTDTIKQEDSYTKLTKVRKITLGSNNKPARKTTIAGGTIDLNGHILDLNGYDVTVTW